MPQPDFDIPSRIRWIAQDSNGAWWGYTDEPHRNDFGWYENEVGDYLRLGDSDPDGWEDSLMQVNR